MHKVFEALAMYGYGSLPRPQDYTPLYGTDSYYQDGVCVRPPAELPCYCVACVAIRWYFGVRTPPRDPRSHAFSDILSALDYFAQHPRECAQDGYVWLNGGDCSIYDWSYAAVVLAQHTYAEERRVVEAARRAEEQRRQRQREQEAEAMADDEVSSYSFRGFKEGAPIREGRGRLCGVEWEFNTCETPRAIRAWARTNSGGIHYDGSCGWECVTPPMGGRAVDRILLSLASAFETARATIDDKCGIHVHVDARDYMWDDMFRFLRVWSKVEVAMFLLGGQYRTSSGYCGACGPQYERALNSRDRKGNVLAVAYGAHGAVEGREVARNRPGKKHQGRYKSVNLCPWLNGRSSRPRLPDSTIEFRLHRNSANGWRVVGWTKLCTAIVEWCATHTDEDALALPKDGLRALCVIAPHLKGWVVRRVRAWRKACSRRRRAMSFMGGSVHWKDRYSYSVDQSADDGDEYAVPPSRAA